MRLRKGSVPYQAVSASGRAGNGRPQETTPSSSSCLWLSCQSPDVQHRPCRHHPGQRVSCVPGWGAEPGGHMQQEMGKQQQPVPCGSWGSFLGIVVCGWVARDAQQPQAQVWKGSVWHWLLLHWAGAGGCPMAVSRGAAGVGAGTYWCLQGWWHRPGRPEPLCYIGCFSYLKQEAAAAEPAKCFVIIHPAVSLLGSRRVHRPISFGEHLHPSARSGNSQPRLSFASWLGYPGSSGQCGAGEGICPPCCSRDWAQPSGAGAVPVWDGVRCICPSLCL